jgi:hypothetical protein
VSFDAIDMSTYIYFDDDSNLVFDELTYNEMGIHELTVSIVYLDYALSVSS